MPGDAACSSTAGGRSREFREGKRGDANRLRNRLVYNCGLVLVCARVVLAFDVAKLVGLLQKNDATTSHDGIAACLGQQPTVLVLREVFVFLYRFHRSFKRGINSS